MTRSGRLAALVGLRSGWRAAVWACLLPAVLAQAGCATAERPDPLEPLNRKIFAFNDAVDSAVLKPVATAYQNNVPELARTAVTNFFGNLGDGWSAVNLFLQGRVIDGMNETMRVLTNSLFGVFGLADVATPLGMERKNQDFGLTLGRWGVPSGAYLMLPLLGPSTLRDSVGLPAEFQFSPERHFDMADPAKYSLTGLKVVNTRANLLGATKLLDDVAVDKYAFLRNAYLQRRRSQVNAGGAEAEAGTDAPPKEERFDLPEETPATEKK